MLTLERLEQMKQNARGFAEHPDFDNIVERVRERVADFPNDPQFTTWLDMLLEARREANDS